MFMHKSCRLLAIPLALAMLASPAAFSDELTAQVQRDLVTLGYDPGNISGEVTTETTVAIARFQAERDMSITGKVSPGLAGMLAAEVEKQRSGAKAQAAAEVAPAQAAAEVVPAQAAAEVVPAQAAAEVVPAQAAVEVVPAKTPEEIEAAQEACLKEKIAEAQQKRKKRRGWGKVISAVSRTASQVGSDDVADTARDVNMATATADDLSQAAEDLGLSEDEIAACRNLQ